ncbi:flavin monoamine oxidase family protein [Capillimicrobium parvum]|uniref:flavin monoamine oxidase family protein n=1 Tax=Capillimicrobium parvum TaxID=2884022 RepID=UPI002E0FB444
MVVIGAGFSGMVAARELRHAGLSVTVAEARDRIGGRTWTDERLGGLKLEMGGAHIHWSQPFLWAEIHRYAQPIHRNEDPERTNWLIDGRFHAGDGGELVARLARGFERYFADALDVFPQPFEPLLNRDAVARLDRQSAVSRLDGLGYDADERALHHAMWSLNFCGPFEEGSLAQAVRWGALAHVDGEFLFSALDDYKLGNGMGALIDAIADDAGAEVRLSAVVNAVEQDDAGVRVVLDGGDVLAASAAIVTVPISTMGAIAFSPSLSAGKQAVIAQGQVSRGFKLWMRARVDDPGPWIAMGTVPHPVTFARRETDLGEGEVLVRAFGSNARALDLTSLSDVQAAMEPLYPGIEILDIACHDWTTDRFARETWPMFKVGQVAEGLEALRAREGRVAFAGSLLANGWTSFVDGAIETGLAAAHDVKQLLRADRARSRVGARNCAHRSLSVR